MLNAAYFSRMDAMDFALGHDDGQSAGELHKADVVLIGVSRTSKTPTCLYLANRGLKAANVPFVPGVALPPELDQLTRPLIVGLPPDPDRLIQIRRNRKKMPNQGGTAEHLYPQVLRAEDSKAPRQSQPKGW